MKARDVRRVRKGLLKVLRSWAWWVPQVLLGVLIVLIGAYTASKTPSFLSEFNLNSLLLATLPLALVAMAQVNALLVGYLDISVGSTMTIGVIVASFLITDHATPLMMVVGVVAVLLAGVGVGIFNSLLVHWVKIPSIIATLATLSILDGISLLLRPIPAGLISFDFTSFLTTSVGFVPIAFVVVLILALAWDIWLHRTSAGLTLRAVGYDIRGARRLGAATTRIRIRALIISGVMAAVASFFLASQIGVGDPRAGSSFALTSIAAAALGGTSIAGGRASFVGAVIAGLFLALIVNVLPFLGASNAFGLISFGAVTVLGLLLYQVADIQVLVKQTWKRFRRRRTA